jgi:gluconokinase
MNDCPLVWIVIGVSGSGKTAIGRLFSQKLECDFLEGDRRHPQTNLSKISSGKALEDEDRLPWILKIERDLQQAIEQNRETIMTCSALRKSYREKLTSLGRVQLIWLDVPEGVLQKRLKERPKHFMKPEMLASQIAAFEPIGLEENVITVDGNLPIDRVMSKLMTKVTQQFPCLKKPWWERCLE